MIHTLLVGAPGVGKSTLIRRLVKELEVSVSGFLTRKEKDADHPTLGNPVYFYPLGEEQVRSPEYLLGHCKDRRPQVYPETFQRLAPQVAAMAGGRLLVMDEIGFMETCSPAFCQAILTHLDGSVPVLAAVKDKQLPFLEQVRTHPRCRTFHITEENRDELYSQVLAFVRAQLEKETPI